MNKISLLMGALLTITVSGCKTLPENLQVDQNAELISYSQVMAQPEQQKGKIALWGGVIASVENKTDATVIEVTYLPLSNNGRPRNTDDSLGRFRVYVKGFLDPMVYGVGREFSVVGQLGGIENGAVGEQAYSFPVVYADDFYLWKEKSTTVTHVDVWPRYGAYWGWRAWPFDYYRPYRTRVITRHRGIRSHNVVNHSNTSSGNNVSSNTPKQSKNVPVSGKKRPTFSPIPDREYKPKKRIEQ